jgi:protein-S-isoprenylcysteine O-methyltransferase Ste14
MDTNTPATPSTPDGDYIQDNVNAARASADKESADKERADKAAVDKASTPTRPKGPNASAIVVGLVAMLFAGLIIAKESMSWQVDWSRLGPGAIVGIGVVLVLIGAIGLIRRHDDA